MLVEVVRLAVGLAMLIFYRRIADFAMVRERALVVLFRQRGVRLPLLTSRTTENIYFGLAVFVCLFQFVRIWALLH
jgi:hypothetical protein